MKKLKTKNNNIKGVVPYQNGLKTTTMEAVTKEKTVIMSQKCWWKNKTK